MSYLIDTNVVSELTKSEPALKVLAWFQSMPNEALYLSVLTIGEIRSGVEKLRQSKRKEKLILWLEYELPQWFENRILSIDESISDRWGRLQHQANRTLPAVDGLLAATALHHDLQIVTRNHKDFDFPFLSLVNPWG